MSKLLEGPVKNGPEYFEITVEIECTKFLKKANNLLETCSSKIKIEDNLYLDQLHQNFSSFFWRSLEMIEIPKNGVRILFVIIYLTEVG